MTTIEQVREFHKAFELADAETPYINNEPLNRLRIKLLQEELIELQEALDARNAVAVLDALTDLQYVLDGAYLQLGFASVKQAAFDAVHASNMSKLGADGKPVKREDGKVQKGPNYKPVDLSRFIPLTDTGVVTTT